jgi:transposase
MTDLRQPERMVTVGAWDQGEFVKELKKARGHFHLGDEAAVYSCYEASRCGFSLHRFLTGLGIENVVVDPASIEVSRRSKHAKTDRLDGERLLRLLVRYRAHGETRCWRVCRAPEPEAEGARRVDREHHRLKKERTAHVNRIRSLLALHGVAVSDVRRLVAGAIRDYAGQLLAVEFQEEIGRELERLALVDKHLEAVSAARNEALEHPKTPTDEKAAALLGFVGVGPVGALALAREFFWRDFRTVREVGAAAGLTGSPYDSGNSRVEQGISKAGSRRIRTLAVELSWDWVRYQRDSALTQWYKERFAHGGKRLRRIGIVAVARKLLVALWKFLRTGQMPEGARYLPMTGSAKRTAKGRGAPPRRPTRPRSPKATPATECVGRAKTKGPLDTTEVTFERRE